MYCCTPKALYNHVGGLSSTTQLTLYLKTSQQHILEEEEKPCEYLRCNKTLKLYLTRYWQPRWYFSGQWRRTGKDAKSGCLQSPPSCASTCTLSPPWGSHLQKQRNGVGPKTTNSCTVATGKLLWIKRVSA